MANKRSRPRITKDRVWSSFSRLADICKKSTEYLTFSKDEKGKKTAKLVPNSWHLSYESQYGGYTITAVNEVGNFENQFLRIPRLDPSGMYFAIEFAIDLLGHLERTGEITWKKKED